MRLEVLSVSAIFVCACGNGSRSAAPDTAGTDLVDGGLTSQFDASPDSAGDAPVASRTAIVFAAALDGQALADLYTIEPDGSRLLRLTRTPQEELYPSWAPDHSRIAFVRDFQLFTITADRGNELRIAERTGKQRTINDLVYSTTLGPAAWSPDGTQLAYPFPRPPNFIDAGNEEVPEIIDQSYGTTIHFVQADGGNDRAIENDPDRTINSIAWAPNNTLSFSQADDCADCAGGSWYAFSNLDGTNYRALPSNGLDQSGPNKHLDWSSDGTRWVYVGGVDYSGYEAPHSIYTSAAFGTDRVQLVAAPAWSPRWSADSSAVAYIGADGIYIIDVTGSNNRRIVSSPSIRGLDW